MTDYHRQNAPRRIVTTLLVCITALCACQEPAADVPSDSPRPLLLVSGQLQDPDVVEASGLSRSLRDPEMLWTLNDGGSKPRLHAFDFNGSKLGRLTLDGARNRDWEDMAAFEFDGEPYLLVADIGDNDARRDAVSLLVVAEPDMAEDDKQREDLAWRVDFRYPDGPRDAEAVAVDAANDRVLVLSKRDLPPRLYAVPLRPGPDEVVTADLLGTVESLPRPSRRDRDQALFTKDWHWQPTAMDLSPDGKLAVILTYRAVYVYRLDAVAGIPASLRNPPHALGLGNFRDAESAAFSADSASIFVTVERKHPPLLRIDLNGALPE